METINRLKIIFLRSSRLKKMSGIIREADDNTLLLIDEFGTGSDPELGGAQQKVCQFSTKKNLSRLLPRIYTNIKLVVNNCQMQRMRRCF